MSKVLKVVAIAAGAVAVIASGGALLAGAGAFLGMTAVTWTTIATIASIASFAAGTGAQLLTKPPPARGSETKIQIGVEPPAPKLLGEAYSAGILRHDTAYGATLNKVPNPYRWMVVVASVAGPLTACTPMVNFAPVDSYYSGFLATDTQLGDSPEGSSLVPPFGPAPGWGASSKLSGQAAIGWNLLFDKDGKRFASGLPNLGAVWQGPKVYDPRQDSTYPGGSGPCRIDDETSWVWDGLPGDLIPAGENPALHAIVYAYGNYQNGKKVFGIGQPVEGIDLAKFVAWANVCAANAWRVSGTIYEPIANRMENLKDIMAAGCGEWVSHGGTLSVRYRAPQVSLATITEDDIADDDFSITAMQSYRDRLNGIVPKYRNPDANWEFTSAEKVSVPTYVTEDGEEKVEERQWNLVKDVDQVAQLAAYALMDARELGPIEVTLKPQWRWVKPGDCLTAEMPSLDYDGAAIVLHKEIDPATGKVKLRLIGETPAKHAYALSLTGTPPPTPALGQTGQERDEIAAGAGDRQVAIEIQQSKNYPADYTATVPSGLLPDTILPKVTLGGADIRTSDNVSYAIVTGGVTASVNNTNGDPDKGTITVSSVDALQGYIDLTVTVSGVDYPAKRIVIQKIVGLPASLGGSGSKIAADNSFNTITGTSYAPITDVLTVTVASGESLYGTAPLDYYVDGVAYRYVTAKWQYSPVGAGTWTDFGGAIDGTTGGGGDDLPGYGDFTHSVSPSAGDYDVRLVAKVSGAGPTVIFTGTATIEAKV